MSPKRAKSGGKKAVKRASGGKKKGMKSKSQLKIEKPDHPDDILPMVLTSATQEIFGCRTDEDVTRENPQKLLKKDDIIEDIKTRAAVSDFSPVKQLVLDYPENELLLIFDWNFMYGQSFYLVLTLEAKERIFIPPEPESSESENPEWVDGAKSPEQKQWISLGSEKELEEEFVKEDKEKLMYKFSRARRKFGMPVCFSNRSVADVKDGYLECASFEEGRSIIKQMHRDYGTQDVPRLQSRSAQTQWKSMRNNFTQYTPRELSEEEHENILQSESLKEFYKLVTPRIFHSLQQEQIMNMFTDDWMALGTDDSPGMVPEGLTLHQAFRIQNYTGDKKITCINWHPTIYGVIAVAMAEKTEQSSAPFMRPSVILLYSFSEPSNPQLLLECPDDILVFQFCPSNPNIIIGGCVNGQIVLWDISAHVTCLERTQARGDSASVQSDVSAVDENNENKTPVVRFCAVSALENSHRASITDVHWLPETFEVTKTGQPVENVYSTCVQAVTCSPDCSLMFWDVRLPKPLSASDSEQNVDQKAQVTPNSVPDTFKHLERTWKPMFRVSLPKISTMGEYAPLKFTMETYTRDGNKDAHADEAREHDKKSSADYSRLSVPSADTLTDLEDVNTKIFIGTQDGEIVYADWKQEKDESGRQYSSRPLLCFSVHHYSVNTVQRSPFFKDIILTGTSQYGGSSFAIWREGVTDGPLLLSPSSDALFTVACWSLSRPAIFFMGREDGSIEVWNLLKKTSKPTDVCTSITNGKITCMKPWSASPSHNLLAVADDLGVVCSFKIARTHSTRSKKEAESVRKYFERQEQRLMDSLKRTEAWAKEKKEAEDVVQKTTEPDIPVKTPEEAEEENRREYDEFLVLEENILKSAGLLPASAGTQDP